MGRPGWAGGKGSGAALGAQLAEVAGDALERVVGGVVECNHLIDEALRRLVDAALAFAIGEPLARDRDEDAGAPGARPSVSPSR